MTIEGIERIGEYETLTKTEETRFEPYCVEGETAKKTTQVSKENLKTEEGSPYARIEGTVTHSDPVTTFIDSLSQEERAGVSIEQGETAEKTEEAAHPILVEGRDQADKMQEEAIRTLV